MFNQYRWGTILALGLLASCSTSEKTEKPSKVETEKSLEKFGFGLDPSPGQEWNGNELGIVFCWCPRGTFLMGSPQGEFERFVGEDQVRVTLTKGFWLGKYEVTQAEYKKLMSKNPSWFAKGGGGEADVQGFDTSRFPVEKVSWDDAMEFCRTLTELEHQLGRLPSDWKYTLPSEAQWEYACRAGTTTATAFGDTLSSTQANFNGNNPYNGGGKGPDLQRTTKVGSYQPNAWGLCDMHGNVWEWCRDWHNRQLPGGTDPEVTDVSGATFTFGDSFRIQRGGSFDDSGIPARRSADRRAGMQNYGNSDRGFRLAAVFVGQAPANLPLSD